MSGFDFSAWSLAVGGIAMMAMVALARIPAWAVGKPLYTPKPVELAFAAALSLAVGAVIVRLVAHEPPRWSALSFGVMLLIQGVSYLVTARRDAANYASTRTLSWFLTGMGVLILAFTLYNLLILNGRGL